MNIVRYPHPALRHRARPLTAIDKQVRLQAAQMLELMYAARGVGLAGNQVAWPYQLFVMNPKADPAQKEHEHVLINPVIVERRGSVEGEEGCLSFPGLYQRVRRAKWVKVQAYNTEGQLVEYLTNQLPAEVSELTTRILQHEIDHLEGILFIDKLGPVARLAARTKVKDFEREFRRAQERGEIPPDAELEKQLAGGAVEL